MLDRGKVTISSAFKNLLIKEVHSLGESRKPIKTGIERIAESVNEKGIPEDQRIQIVIGIKKKNGQFVAYGPTMEEREAELKKKYGTVKGAVFIQLVDQYE